MLVLSRLRDETIVVGGLDELYVKDGDRFVPVGSVRITVVDIRGDKARLGTAADERVSVHREEVLNAIKRERSGAA